VARVKYQRRELITLCLNPGRLTSYVSVTHVPILRQKWMT
jgi:hypothetical protein